MDLMGIRQEELFDGVEAVEKADGSGIPRIISAQTVT